MAKETLRHGKHIVQEGENFFFPVYSPLVTQPRIMGGRVEKIHTGGFYGPALIYDDIVLKTTEVTGMRRIGRQFNWDHQAFPPATLSSAATLDHLSAHIIHLVMPEVTQGAVVTPASYGFADLGPFGYGQVLERVRGHGARFDKNEYPLFRAYRRHIWQLGSEMGLEPAAQVHHHNPFGGPNLWRKEDGTFMWFDVTPAMRHTEWVFPYYWPLTNIFHFPFHREVREAMGENKPTFNKIHTNMLRTYLRRHPIATDTNVRLHQALEMYDDTQRRYERERNESPKKLLVDDLLRRGDLDDATATKLRASDGAAIAYMTERNTDALVDDIVAAVRENQFLKFFGKQFYEDVMRFVNDGDFRFEKVAELTIMKGLKSAHDEGLVTDEQWYHAWEVLSNPAVDKDAARKLLLTYINLELFYFTSSQLFNLVELGSYAHAIFLSENPALSAAFGVVMGWVVPPVVRATVTAAVGKITGQDLRYATVFSLVPKGAYVTAITADIGHRVGNRSELIWHYTKRAFISWLSESTRKWGGWHSDHEAALWKRLKADKW